ncbi:MAG: short-chain dehydrogenase [Candidatus Meridianibacter frigidus]|nr:MAG: short-chain dehydrogenase [Candidatus Eremiobacteraeota bacterium]
MTRQNVLISGASQGLGAELARLFAARGYGLALSGRDKDRLDSIAAELRKHTDVLAITADLRERAQGYHLVESALAHFGHLDMLINNASTLGGSPMPQLLSLDDQVFRQVLEVNLVAPLALIKGIVPSMQRRGSGTVVNITSDAAVQAYAGWGAYGSSKAALEHLSRILSEELADTGVRVRLVDPGNMNTQMHADAEPGVDLSTLPHPRSVAPKIIGFLERSSEPFARYEVNLGAAV